MIPQNVEVAIRRLRLLADTALGSLYEVECQREMRNACILLENAYHSQAKEPEASGGLCEVAPHAVRVGSSVVGSRTATSERRDVTAGETAPHFHSSAETEEEFEEKSQRNDAADNLRLIDFIADKIGLPNNEELSRDNFVAWLNRVEPQTAGVWQPIETAPKDGTHIWAYQIDRCQYECWWKDDLHYGCYWMDDADSEPSPTHWRPLPETPSALSRPHGGGK